MVHHCTVICRSLLSLTEVPVKLASVEEPFKGYIIFIQTKWINGIANGRIWELQGFRKRFGSEINWDGRVFICLLSQLHAAGHTPETDA